MSFHAAARALAAAYAWVKFRHGLRRADDERSTRAISARIAQQIQ
jgi:hypothetical protein